MKSYNIAVYQELRSEGYSALSAIFYARKWQNMDYKVAA